MDNRPLRFEEWDAMRPQTIAASATPGNWEMEEAGGVFAEQVIRPTDLIDPPVEIRPAKTQVDDVLGEIRNTAKKGYRTLVTVLTKRMAEDLTSNICTNKACACAICTRISTRWRASKSLERPAAWRFRRAGRHQPRRAKGLDILTCRLRRHSRRRQGRASCSSETSLIQTIREAAPRVMWTASVILYADNMHRLRCSARSTKTNRRRESSRLYNGGMLHHAACFREENISVCSIRFYERDRRARRYFRALPKKAR